MARRRELGGRPLLVATATAAMLVGCGAGSKAQPDPPPGNLMAPPTRQVEVCVDTEPEDAKVELKAAKETKLEERCGTIEVYDGGAIELTVSAIGYVREKQSLSIGTEPKVEAKVTLQLQKDRAADPPVGNLMPPPGPPGSDELAPPPPPQ